MFAICKSIAVKITHDFCDTIIRISSNFIKLLQSQIEKTTAMELFKSDCNCKVSQKVGRWNPYFHSNAENKRKFDYYCKKQRHPINTQAVVGSNLLFLDVST